MSTTSDEIPLRPHAWRDAGHSSELSAFLLLLGNLTARNLKVKFQRSFLGLFWTLLNPLATTLTLIAVFGSIVRLPIQDYWAFLLSGFFVWTFLNMALTSATYALSQNAAVIRAAKAPAEVFVLAGVTSRLVEFLIEIVLVAVLLAVFHHHAMPASFALLPVLILAQLLFTLGLVLPIAAFSAFYDDVQHSLPVVFMVLFYISPVFYPASMVPEHVAGLYQLNPIAGLLGLYQRVLYDGQAPSLEALGIMLLVGAVVCVAGALEFRRFRRVFPEVL